MPWVRNILTVSNMFAILTSPASIQVVAIDVRREMRMLSACSLNEVAIVERRRTTVSCWKRSQWSRFDSGGGLWNSREERWGRLQVALYVPFAYLPSHLPLALVLDGGFFGESG